MDDGFVYLTTAANEMEANIIRSKLDFYDIPVLLKHQGSGAFMSILSGYSNMPVDIYVKDIIIEEARKILDIKEEKGSV
jgi:hypothetical protein